MTRRLVLFDIDGTLLLTAGAGRRAITRALAELVGDVTAFERVRFDGKTDPQIVAELLVAAADPDPGNPERIAQVCTRYTELLEVELGHPRTRISVMPGVHPELARLEEEPDVVLGLLTGNLARGAALKLAAAGLAPDRFRVGAYGSDSGRRPDLPAIAASRAEAIMGRVPSGDEVVIIGDTPADVACGAGICARAVAVATGSYSVDELVECGPHAVFADLSDTDRVLTAILD